MRSPFLLASNLLHSARCGFSMLKALRSVRYLALPVAAVALVTCAEWLANMAGDAPAHAATWNASGFGPASYPKALSIAESAIAMGKERVSKGEDEWLRHESLAQAHLRRSSLAIDYDDLILSGKALTRANRLAPPGSGPLLTEAVYAHKTHQLGRLKEALLVIDNFAVHLDPLITAESASLRGDVAFYSGQPEKARRYYAKAASHDQNAGVFYRQAILAKSKGDFDGAIAHFNQANMHPATSTPFANATTAMQIGAVEMARGNYEAASEWFTAADRQFSGFWLIEAHLAQAKAIEGNLAGAISDMRAIANRAPSAEIMDALAMMLRADGQAAESRRWARRAGEIWAIRLKQLPEASYGHALEHELVFGLPSKALDLAKRNVAARPYGEARLLLAAAHLANGQTREAVGELALAERSGWRSAPLYALKAQALEVSGRSNDARRAREVALSLNPRIFDQETSLVWFSHG